MEKDTDYQYATKAIQMDARNPFEKINVGVVLTKKYLFTIPLEDILYSWNLIALNCLLFDRFRERGAKND